MDPAEKFDDHRRQRRIFRFPFCADPVGNEQAQARSWIGFDHEEDRLASFLHLFHSQRSKDAVIDGVVEEQDLGRFDKNRGQWQQSVIDKRLNA